MLCIMVTSPLAFDPCTRSCMDASTLAALACNRAFVAVHQVHQLWRRCCKTRRQEESPATDCSNSCLDVDMFMRQHSSLTLFVIRRREGDALELCFGVKRGHLCRRHSPTRQLYSRPPPCPSSWSNTSFKQTISTRFLPEHPERCHRQKRNPPSAAV